MCLIKRIIVIRTPIFKTKILFFYDLWLNPSLQHVTFCHQKQKQNWVCSMEHTPLPFWDSVFSSVKWSVGLHSIVFKFHFRCGDWKQIYMNCWEMLACLISGLICEFLSHHLNLSNTSSFSLCASHSCSSAVQKIFLSEWFILLDLCCQKGLFW